MSDLEQMLENPQDEPIEIPADLGGEPITAIDDTVTKLIQLVFGLTKSGKTHYAGTAALVPQMCPVFVLNVDGGTETLRTMTRTLDVNPKDVFIVTPRAYPTINGQPSKMSKFEHTDYLFSRMQERVIAGDWPFKTLIVDSLSELEDVAFDWWLKKEKARNPSRDLHIPGEDAGLHERGGPNDFGRDYRKIRGIMRQMVRGFRDLGMHTIYTSHSNEITPMTLGYAIDTPSFTGKSVTEVPGFINEVHKMYVKDEEVTPQGSVKDRDADGNVIPIRFLQCQPTKQRPYCGSRGGLPIVLARPTVAKVVELAEIPLA